MKEPLGGAFGLLNNDGHQLGPMQSISVPMRRFGEEEVDYCVVGVGAAGGVDRDGTLVTSGR